jgi:hypothetical protein
MMKNIVEQEAMQRFGAGCTPYNTGELFRLFGGIYCLYQG